VIVPGIPRFGTTVRYQGSAAPQWLDVYFVAQSAPHPGSVRSWAASVVDGVARGGAGSDLFDPRLGAAAVADERLEGPRGVVRFEVAGVAPHFLRLVMETLAHRLGPLESLVVQGSLAPSGDAASIDTERMLAWLGSPTEYPRRWPGVPFPVLGGDAGGAALRVKLAAELDAALRQELTELVFVWRGLVIAMPTPGGTYPGDQGDRVLAQLPTVGFSKTELRACFPEFVHAVEPGA
jgi:hypothetical protein